MNISHVDLRHLRYFIAVAEELNFSRAAERLHISQPPLSQTIQNLEASLGVSLFMRTKRKVQLTDAGAWLLPAARKLLQETKETLLHTQAAARGETGELRIGSNFSSPLNPRFAKLISEFRAKHPQVRLLFREALFHEAVAGLQNGTLDLGFTWPIKMQPLGDIHFHLVSQDPLYLCVPAGSRLAKKRKLDITDLQDELLILSSRQTQTELFQQLEAEAHAAGFYLRVTLETVHFPIIINLVAAGYGLGILPRFMGRMAKLEDVVFRPLPALKPALCQIPFVVAYNGAKTSLLVKNFLDIA